MYPANANYERDIIFEMEREAQQDTKQGSQEANDNECPEAIREIYNTFKDLDYDKRYSFLYSNDERIELEYIART